MLEQRPQDLVAVDAQVEDACACELRGLAQVARDACPRHVEGKDLGDDGTHGLRRLDAQRRAQHVAVEDRVEVLVGGDAQHDAVGHRILRVATGVAVRDARRHLLEGHVGEAAQRVDGLALEAALELAHAAALEEHRVEVARHHQVVAQHDGVPALLGRPAAHPAHPGPLALPEHGMDEPVIAGQVVLRQEAHLERRLGHAREPRLVRGPWLAVVVSPQPVGDVLVGEPLLGHTCVPVVEPAHHGLKLGQERVDSAFSRHLSLGQRADRLPGGLPSNDLCPQGTRDRPDPPRRRSRSGGMGRAQ